MTHSGVALLVPYRIQGSQGPEVFVQIHTDGRTARLFGGHIEKGETPLEAIIRETKEELNLDFKPQVLGEGWTPFQLVTRLRVSFAGVYLFPLEVTEDPWPPVGWRLGEGSGSEWRSLSSLVFGSRQNTRLSTRYPPKPARMSFSDRLLIRVWAFRRFALSQPYMASPFLSPILTIDLEESHHLTGRCASHQLTETSRRLPETIQSLLERLSNVKATATFFCVAQTAIRFKELIREIAKQGHEVASHGTDHCLASIQNPTEFKEDVTVSKKILEDIIQREVNGYRAPAWSWPRDATLSSRFYEILKNTGYIYDSSVIPESVFGTPGLPDLPFRADSGVWEFPLSISRIPFTKNLNRLAKGGTYQGSSHTWLASMGIPYSGGLFMRCLGHHVSRLLISYHLKKNGYVLVYFHPHELSGEDGSWVWRLDHRYLNLLERWRVGFRTRRLGHHLYSIISNHSGISIGQFLRTYTQN